MNAELRLALDHAYEVFARYEDSYGFAKRSGVSRSLRDLTREDWSVMDEKFDMGVHLWEEDAVLLRHFLPRFLEWESNHFISPLESWDLKYRLDYLHWLEWPTEEVECLRPVFCAWARAIQVRCGCPHAG